ncbi:hypothetical protein EDD21DRAFT_384857 [Dissophora ornata]|nr:hypothetical protein EDD21DRAFT_384857 [Dissophora ornata]
MHSSRNLILRSSKGLVASLITRRQTAIAASTHVSAFRTGLCHQKLPLQQQERTFVSPSRVMLAASGADIEKGVQNITDLFMTARDELEYAEEARGTVYYNDDKETAREAVQECLTAYNELLTDLNEAQKLDVQRKIGLKIMELKSQLDALNAEELE